MENHWESRKQKRSRAREKEIVERLKKKRLRSSIAKRERMSAKEEDFGGG